MSRRRTTRHPSRKKATRRPAIARSAKSTGTVVLRADEIDALRQELERSVPSANPARWNADPEDVQRSVAKLVLTLVEFVRALLERQALRRVEAGTLTVEETEAIGVGLMRLEETLHDLAARFGLAPEDLNLDLGPFGRLM